jgi:hypothetical protein
MADFLNNYRPGLGYWVIFASYGILFLLSTVSLLGVALTADTVKRDKLTGTGLPQITATHRDFLDGV